MISMTYVKCRAALNQETKDCLKSALMMWISLKLPAPLADGLKRNHHETAGASASDLSIES